MEEIMTLTGVVVSTVSTVPYFLSTPDANAGRPLSCTSPHLLTYLLPTYLSTCTFSHPVVVHLPSIVAARPEPEGACHGWRCAAFAQDRRI